MTLAVIYSGKLYHDTTLCSCHLIILIPYSPGYIDLQLNGAYGFDFSVYEGNDDTYMQGIKLVAERIVETGVTS